MKQRTQRLRLVHDDSNELPINEECSQFDDRSLLIDPEFEDKSYSSLTRDFYIDRTFKQPRS